MTNNTKIGLTIAAAFMLVLSSSCIKNICGDGICQPREEKNGSCLEDCEKITPDESLTKLKSITTIKEYGKSLDWSHAKNLISFGRLGKDGYYDVHVMEPDGSDEHCLTCDKEGCPQKHNGNPVWHPLGDYIVFTAEKRDNPEEYKEWAIPGTGFNCDLWVMTDDGGKFYQLTNYSISQPFKAVIHPQFSHNGKKLFWAERIKQGESFAGGWVLKIADFVIDSKGPHLENIQTIEPGEQSCFYESHAFSNDDNWLLFSGDLMSGQPPFGLDIYELNLEINQLQRLTDTPNEWDEHAHYSPDSKKIAWMSSTGFNIDWGDISGHNWQKYLITELWIMNTDGSNKQQLTHFNDPGHPEYMNGKRCVVSDSSWSPDSKKIIALVAYDTILGIRSKIVMIEFE